ncbi:uncharacterized protein B0I36DRAFT_348287 [Microdochium trichocladiopsis]|uniref:Uncharacterized protein n=1 Tax=Microdochium trichocladiopsis TaxID=1682393 RepID=A0A9P9BRY0_9PEZI|nr:uncharacterized protein B0I36DRAFT_348287 [Microdochium trichocladiopsis]KAH7033193.1 hypothetical protein B0I36DRAFT_348287 [Microdochium trichocladiopsis]
MALCLRKPPLAGAISASAGDCAVHQTRGTENLLGRTWHKPSAPSRFSKHREHLTLRSSPCGKWHFDKQEHQTRDPAMHDDYINFHPSLLAAMSLESALTGTSKTAEDTKTWGRTQTSRNEQDSGSLQ